MSSSGESDSDSGFCTKKPQGRSRIVSLVIAPNELGEDDSSATGLQDDPLGNSLQTPRGLLHTPKCANGAAKSPSSPSFDRRRSVLDVVHDALTQGTTAEVKHRVSMKSNDLMSPYMKQKLQNNNSSSSSLFITTSKPNVTRPASDGNAHSPLRPTSPRNKQQKRQSPRDAFDDDDGFVQVTSVADIGGPGELSASCDHLAIPIPMSSTEPYVHFMSLDPPKPPPCAPQSNQTGLNSSLSLSQSPAVSPSNRRKVAGQAHNMLSFSKLPTSGLSRNLTSGMIGSSHLGHSGEGLGASKLGSGMSFASISAAIKAEELMKRKEERDKKHVEALDRLKQQQKSELEQRELQLAAHNVKIAEAAERKVLLEEHRHHQRALSWLMIMFVARFYDFATETVTVGRERERVRHQFLPHIVMRIRRVLRRARTRLYSKGLPKPTIQSLRFDKMLNLFSDAHLQHYIDCLKPKYFFLNETIIFMGSEDDEAYVLASGSADVMMGANKVFTLKAGMSFGTVGMISGEPRTASIVAREPCIVWLITRDKFEAYGTSDNQVTAALAIIAELRQTNMRNVYKQLLDPHYLETFRTFMRVGSDTLANLIQSGTPKVVKAGAMAIDPSMAHGDMPRWFLLRGMIRVSLPHGVPFPRDPTLKELLGRLVDFPRKRGPNGVITDQVIEQNIVTQTLHRMSMARVRAGRMSVSQPSVTTLPDGTKVVMNPAVKAAGLVVAEYTGPLLLNIAPFFLQETLPLIVECVNGCDLISFTKEMFTTQDILDLASIRQNCYNLHCAFMEPLTKQLFTKAFFRNSPALDEGLCTDRGLLSTLCSLKGTDSVPQTNWVFGQQDFLYFDPNHNLEIMVVMKGELEGAGKSSAEKDIELPFVWPELHMLFFGSTNAVVRAKSRVDVVMIPRGEFIKWLCDELDEADLTALVKQLAHYYVLKTGKRPVFSYFGIECVMSSKGVGMMSSSLAGGGGGMTKSKSFHHGFGGSEKKAAVALAGEQEPALIAQPRFASLEAAIESVMSRLNPSAIIAAASRIVTAPTSSVSNSRQQQGNRDLARPQAQTKKPTAESRKASKDDDEGESAKSPMELKSEATTRSPLNSSETLPSKSQSPQCDLSQSRGLLSPRPAPPSSPSPQGTSSSLRGPKWVAPSKSTSSRPIFEGSKDATQSSAPPKEKPKLDQQHNKFSTLHNLPDAFDSPTASHFHSHTLNTSSTSALEASSSGTLNGSRRDSRHSTRQQHRNSSSVLGNSASFASLSSSGSIAGDSGNRTVTASKVRRRKENEKLVEGSERFNDLLKSLGSSKYEHDAQPPPGPRQGASCGRAEQYMPIQHTLHVPPPKPQNVHNNGGSQWRVSQLDVHEKSNGCSLSARSVSATPTQQTRTTYGVLSPAQVALSDGDDIAAMSMRQRQKISKMIEKRFQKISEFMEENSDAVRPSTTQQRNGRSLGTSTCTTPRSSDVANNSKRK